MLHALLLAALVGPPAGPALSADQLPALVREIAGTVEGIRHLKFKTPVAMEIIDGRAVRERFQSEIDAATLEQARHEQDAYVQLRLVPPGTDLVRNYLDMAEQQVLGFYDSSTKKLYLVSHTDAREVRGVIAHELTHALEDQYYDLGALRKKAHSDDQSTAIRAVAEGSAMVVQITFQRDDPAGAQAAQESELGRAATVAGAPSFAQQTVMLPYLLGFSFLLRGRPWALEDGVLLADIDAAYRNPPMSTRQILHPEQYWWGQGRKTAPPLTLPDLSGALGPGWSKAAEGSVGELGLAVLTGSRLDVGSFRALLPASWTSAAAAGSTGDVYQHYVNGTRKVTVLRTQWESARDAEEFGRALLSRGSYFVSMGINVLVVAGDIGDKGPTVGIAALQGAAIR